MKCKLVEKKQFFEMVWSLVNLLWSFVDLNSARPDWGTFFLLSVAVAVCTVLFSCWSPEAGGLASGQHAHNLQQSLSHHFIFPVLWSSLASVCRYGNFASEFHWWSLMKFLCDFSRWETRSSERINYLSKWAKSRLNYFRLQNSQHRWGSKHFSDHQTDMFMAFTSECVQNPIIYENNVILKSLSAL